MEDETAEQFIAKLTNYRAKTNRILGHLEMLIDSGFIDGISIKRSTDGHLYYAIYSPRLTMAGHDLLDTIRSRTLWEKIKYIATNKGIDLTFDIIKNLVPFALKQIIG